MIQKEGDKVPYKNGTIKAGTREVVDRVLNNTNYKLLYNVVQYFKKYDKITTSPVFFDVGCYAGSFIKVLQNNNYNNI